MWVASFHGLRSQTEEKGDCELSANFYVFLFPDWMQCDQLPASWT